MYDGYAVLENFTSCFNCLLEKPERKRLLDRPKHRWEDIVMNLKKIGYRGVD